MMRCAYKAILMAALLLVLLCGLAFAETTADGFEYSVSDGKVTITGYTMRKYDLIIPEEIEGLPVVEIGKRAISFCRIKSVYIPDSVTRIAEYAFRDCKQLESVRLPEGLTEIEGYVFWNCIQLKSVTLPERLTEIKDSAFNLCESLTKINLPSGLKTIGKEAFAGTSLQEVILPDGLQAIGERAFAETKITSIYIPDNVTEIGKGAFAGCTKNQSARIPDHLTEIPDKTFAGNYGLTEINWPSKLEIIGEEAFQNCGIKEVILPESVRVIGKKAFFETGIDRIHMPDSVTEIHDGAFANCRALVDVRMSRNIRSIGEDAFAWCASMRGFRVDEKLQSKTKDLILPEGLEYLGARAFIFCDFTSISIPGTLKEIPEYAFEASIHVKEIVLGEGVETIGNYAFADGDETAVEHSGTVSLSSLTLPTSLKSIGDQAFQHTGITKIVIPNGVTHIGRKAFMRKGGKTMTAYLPAELSDIGAFAFGKGSTLYCVKDSASHNWAKEQGNLRIQLLEEGGGILELREDEICLGKGNAYQLSWVHIAAGEPQFTSSNPSVATVDDRGLVTAVGDGETEITFSGDGRSLKCRIFVGQAMDSFSLRFSKLAVEPGDCFWIPHWLSMSIEPGELSKGETLVYKSSDASVISVDGKYMTAGKEGSAIVTIYDRFNPKTAVEIAVTVSSSGIDLPEDLKIVRDMSFYRSGVECVRIHEGIEKIEEAAFTMCEDLHTVRFEGMEIDIDSDAFMLAHEDCVFLCYQHSMAHDFAEGWRDFPCVFFKK